MHRWKLNMSGNEGVLNLFVCKEFRTRGAHGTFSPIDVACPHVRDKTQGCPIFPHHVLLIWVSLHEKSSLRFRVHALIVLHRAFYIQCSM